MVRKVGNGDSTRLWLDCWIGDAPLCVIFPCTFPLSTQKETVIREVYVGRRTYCVYAE
jgi:hypothetical protein